LEPSIRVTSVVGRVVVRWNDHVLVDTLEALELFAPGLPPTLYFAPSDVDMRFLQRSARQLHCRYRGDGRYFTLVEGRELVTNAAWTLESPTASLEAARNCIAFDEDKVQIERAAAA